jgi:hypothetical protein
MLVAVLGLTSSVQSTLFPSSSLSSLSLAFHHLPTSSQSAAMTGGRRTFRGGGGGGSKKKKGGRYTHTHTRKGMLRVCVCMHEGPGAQVTSRPVLPVPSSKTDADSFLSGTRTPPVLSLIFLLILLRP